MGAGSWKPEAGSPRLEAGGGERVRPTVDGLALAEGYAVHAGSRESEPVGVDPGLFWWKAVDSWDEIPAEHPPDEETPG